MTLVEIDWFGSSPYPFGNAILITTKLTISVGDWQSCLQCNCSWDHQKCVNLPTKVFVHSFPSSRLEISCILALADWLAQSQPMVSWKNDILDNISYTHIYLLEHIFLWWSLNHSCSRFTATSSHDLRTENATEIEAHGMSEDGTSSDLIPMANWIMITLVSKSWIPSVSGPMKNQWWPRP